MSYDFDAPITREADYALKWKVDAGVIPLWLADMDFACAPEVVQAVKDRCDAGPLGYTYVPEEWNDAIAGWWSRRHGLAVDARHIAFATGVIPLLSACVRAFSGEHGQVAVLSPGYNCFTSVVRNAGCGVREVELVRVESGYAIDFTALEEAFAEEDVRVFLLCNPHNPTGNIWDADDLARIGELCKRYGVVAVSDEIHCDIVAPGAHHVPFAAASEVCARVSVTCGAPTKAFNMAGLKSAYFFAEDDALRTAVARELAAAGHETPNAFAVQAAMAAYGKSGDWLDEMNAYVQDNRAFVEGFLAGRPQMGIDLVPARATYLCWLDCRRLLEAAGKKSTHLFQKKLLKEHGVFVYPGMIYGQGGKRYLRMNIATRRALLQEALERMEAACKDYLG